DRALVTRAQAGDRGAFDDLYVRYYRRLYRFCLRRLHDAHEAEDVAQEAFARAWRALPSFGGDRRFYPWLSVIAAHLCTDVLRRRNRSTPVAEFHQGNVASTEDGGEEIALAAVDSAIVAKAFTRLSDRHQRILHLREGSGWSYQKIADHEGVGITAVETLLWRARQALKREFASLAGADGRMAGLFGGVFSLSALRRLLRHGMRKAATVGPRGAMLATMGSAAATAVVVTAVMSGPSAPATHPGSPVPTVITPSSSSSVTGSPTGTGGSTGANSADATGGAGTGTTGGLGGGTSGNPPGGVGNITSGVGGAVSNLGGTVTSLGNTLGGVVGGLPAVGGTLGNTVQGVTNTLGGALGSAGNAASSSGSGAGASGASSAASGVTNTVNGLLGGVGHLLP
ncbi:MAG TPA: sigma-70 family RNA polymerase sigma factor, partial [Acidimicrobiales bacterium]|nr:sigma-70 family RNA polymerase sigma factor [Acidimicrobiales bacterium]